MKETSTKVDIACVNKEETEMFPCKEYRITMNSADDYAHPCIYIESFQDDYCVQASIQGNVTKVIRCGQKETETVKDVEERLSLWLPKLAKSALAYGKTNYEFMVHVWEIIR